MDLQQSFVSAPRIPNFQYDASGWPIWPRASQGALDALNAVLYSGRWSISGFAVGSAPFERQFAQEFAEWMDVPFCIPTANGTSALIAALEALDVGDGDEVIVPALTWVAPAVAVLQVNARPIIAEIDPETLCISVEEIERMITPRTRAIIVVHLYSSVADLDAVLTLAARHNIAVVEDCAQSHGSIWRGRKVGSFGDVGIFSMHQGKPLSCGEGGAAITHNRKLAERMEQLRANGRQYVDPPAERGDFDLREVGALLGTNMALSEFHAAVALDGLSRIEAETDIRAESAAFLDREIMSQVDGVHPIGRPNGVDRQAYYHYVLRFDPDAFGGVSSTELARRLTDSLGCLWQPTYVPLRRHPLYAVSLQKRYDRSVTYGMLRPAPSHQAASERAYKTTVIVHHRILLADHALLERIPKALRIIQQEISK